MHVLYNALQAGNRSGTGTYTEELARRLPGLAEDTGVSIVWPQTEPIPPDIGGAVIRQPVRGALSRIHYDQHGFPKEARRIGAGLLHYPANAGALRPGIPQVITVTDVSFMRNPAWFRADRAAYYRFFVPRAARCAARIIALSEAAAGEIAGVLRFPRGRIDVTPCGVDERFRPAGEAERERVRGAYNLPARFFLYAGTHEPRKNLPRLIAAWSAIAEKTDLDLVLAGRSGWKTSAIRRAAARSPHRERIHFCGFIESADLPAVLSAAGVFVYPSLYEGFGLPVLEAMACGTAVITSSVSSLPEVAGDAALLVPPADADALAESLLTCANEPSLCGELRAKGLVRARSFTWERTAALTVEAYRHALA